MNPFIHRVCPAPLAAGLTAAQLALACSPAWGLDLNRATESELRTVQGIGPKTAVIILRERIQSGPFRSMDDLAKRVSGIGPKKAVALRAAGLEVESSTHGASNSAASAKPGPARIGRRRPISPTIISVVP